MMARVVVASLLAVVAVSGSQAAGVRVWQGTLQLPTYAEGPANPNPPFDLFTFGRYNYPYPIRDALTDRREDVSWRSLHLENAYLRLTVLPDLGGHVYSCLDKRSGREMFYANTAIKKALIGYRGAWAAFGVEFNFPVSHNWMSMSPVDFATAQHGDGSGSIYVGNIDQVYGSQWRVELRLRPARAVLEQHVELYNPSDVRHRYYWWSNAAVQAWEDSRLVYPTVAMTTHGFTSVEPWPVKDDRDLSVIRNQTTGPVSLFTYQTREEFVGVYHPRTNSGTVHVASRAELPTHKVWSWGNDREAAFWRAALSDDDSGYVELQAGLFRNQETYAFLEPQQSVQFSEYWLPVRDLGGITRANVDAVLHMQRLSPARVTLALDVTREFPGARVNIRGGRLTAPAALTMSPREVWRADVDAAAEPVTFELIDRDGTVILAHTENVFDSTPASGTQYGPSAHAGIADTGSTSGILENGELHELEGRRLIALSAYQKGLETDAQSALLAKAAGRLALALGWLDAIEPARRVVNWLEGAHRRAPTDFETEYYFGRALASAGRPREARQRLESARRFGATRVAAAVELARLLARDGNLDAALRAARAGVGDGPRAWAAGAIEAALLRRMGLIDEARDRARHWRTVDPTNSVLRYELTLNGAADPDLWGHFGADANRVLDVVDHYLAIADYQAALGLLEKAYPAVPSPLREPGAVIPGDSPLVHYYRGYVRERLGRDPKQDFDRARTLSTAHVFPARRSTYAVLHAALRVSPDDATARYLLGAAQLASGLTASAIDSWQRVRRVRPDIPTLHRNLGLALLHGRGDHAAARAVLEEGVSADPRNVEVYGALDAVLSAAGVAPAERVAALRKFPSPDGMPSALVFKLALALAEAGEADAAERLFHDGSFRVRKGGPACERSTRRCA